MFSPDCDQRFGQFVRIVAQRCIGIHHVSLVDENLTGELKHAGIADRTDMPLRFDLGNRRQQVRIDEHTVDRQLWDMLIERRSREELEELLEERLALLEADDDAGLRSA